MRVAIKFCRYPKSESEDNKKNDPFFLAGENESRHVLKARREPSTCEEVVLAVNAANSPPSGQLRRTLNYRDHFQSPSWPCCALTNDREDSSPRFPAEA